jgi:hypothetical protein
MCEQCAELDEKIERYGALARRVTDQRMLEAIASLIKQMEARKTALHPSGC